MATPLKFSFGFANSMFQSSGNVCGASNWTEAAQKGTVPQVKLSLSHWDTFEHDLNLMQAIGIDTYRISMEWSHIEPQQGHFDHRIIRHYQRLIDACLERQINPMITLYHFNEPLWFTRLGGFEHEENIGYFVDYCQRIFPIFSLKVSLWCTINEPAVQAFSSYLWGQFPPHKHNLQLTITVLKHLLKAHVEVYLALKSLQHHEATMVGLVHNVLRFKPLYSYDLFTHKLCDHLTTITNDLVIQFFTSGHFDYDVPLLAIHEHHQDLRAPHANDFIGLNFYANSVIGPNMTNGYGATCYAHQDMGDMFLPIDAIGFSNAIDEVARLNKPIYITETGIADHTDTLRQKLITQYVAVIKRKRDHLMDIRACYFWTLRDNYEWNEGQEKRLFGFYDAKGNPRDSVDVLKKIIRDFNDIKNKPREFR